MKNNIKHFFIGAFIALVPMSFYAYSRFNPPTIQAEYLSSVEIHKSLTSAQVPSEKPIPTIPPPQVLSSPSQKSVNTAEATTNKKTASLEVHPQPAPEEIRILIEKYSTEYVVDKNMMIEIATCESGFRSNAVNGPYAGIYQFVTATWMSNRSAMGADTNPNLRFNIEESVKTAAFKMSRDGFGAWPVCQQKARRALSYQN